MPQTDNPVCGIFSINPMGISLPIPFAAHPFYITSESHCGKVKGIDTYLIFFHSVYN